MPNLRQTGTDISLYDILRTFKDNLMEELNCFKIGIIKEFDYQNQTVGVEIASKDYRENEESDTLELFEYPYLSDVPYIVLGGDNGYLSFPIKEGDECLIIFNDEDFSQWKETGQVLPPYEIRRHDITDCVALIGLRNVNRLIKNYSQFVKLLFTNEKGTSFLELQDSLAHLKVEGKDSSTVTVDSATEVNINTAKTNLSAELNVGTDANITGNTTTTGNNTTNGNTVTLGNTDSATYSTNGVVGITGTFIHAAGVKLTFTNGLITNVG